ncbi:MAG: DUF1501 domain-containing protein [Planctomycetota bacterium]|nr:MAG: DUF1501 domain-containing protein [Planctomycetota bacterium]
MSLSRRALLHRTGAAGLVAFLPQPLRALRRDREDRRLVLLFLDGGNDGLNTVAPIADDLYHKARPKLQLAGDLPRLDDATALHPSLAPWKTLFDAGSLAILRNVGYDRPNRSHFVSRDIWHSGQRAGSDLETDYVSTGRDTGWVARALERTSSSGLPPVALGTGEAPLILRGSARGGLTLDSPEAFQVQGDVGALRAGASATSGASDALQRIAAAANDAYAAADSLRRSIDSIPAGDGYPDNALADRLKLAARLLRAESGPPVAWTFLGGFDTHAVQAGTHAVLLDQVATATTAFLRDLQRDGTDRRVLTLVYSEFGRRVHENGSAGTDHGAAAPVFALGPVNGGLHGPPPDLENLDDGDVRATADFRSVFAEAAAWMGWGTDELFDGEPADAPPYLT